MLKTLAIYWILSFGLGIPVFSQTGIPDTLKLALVNGEPITYAEYMYFQSKNKASVLRYFRDTYKLNYGNDFWEQSCNNETPKQRLMQCALNEAIEAKAQQIIAQKFQLVDNISYTHFLVKLKNENKRRIEAVSQNQVIFGPVQYTESVYYDYLLSNMLIQLKKTLAKNVFTINDSILHNNYELLKDSLFKKGYTSRVSILKVAFKEKGEQTFNTDNKAMRQLNTVQSKLKNGMPFEKIVKNKKLNKNLVLIHHEISISNADYKSEETELHALLIPINPDTCKVGAVNLPIKKGNHYYFTRLLARDDLGYRSFEECRNVVYSALIEKYYSRYLTNWINTAEVELYNQNIIAVENN
jgi:hypothetical protein